jgi:hypothetical protein
LTFPDTSRTPETSEPRSPDEPDRAEDDAIRALVTRLSRAHPSGGKVIERAAILAAGTDSAAIMSWIAAHAGEPEATVSASRAGGLHGSRSEGGRAPLRYVLPAGALD